MTALLQLQEELQDHLLDRPSAIRACLSRSGSTDIDTQLAIYRNAYLGRLVEVLRSDFPKLHRLAGDLRFEELCRAYLARHPSRHRSTRWIAGDLASFLSLAVPFAERPELCEMARFEWALAAAFDAADAPVEPLDALAAVPASAWGSIRIRLHPAAVRLDLRSNVPDVWGAIEQGLLWEPPTWSADAILWLIWRMGLGVKLRQLAPDEAWALDAMHGGADFAGMCEGLERWCERDRIAFRAAALIKEWIEAGLVSGLDHDAAAST